MVLADRVRASVRTYGLWPRGGRVLVALSGGPDSTRSCTCWGSCRHADEVELAGVAHLNHGLRAAAAERRGVLPQPCERTPRCPSTSSRSASVNWRVSGGRRLKMPDGGPGMRWFERVATEIGADAIATGHTRDDQAETFLLQLLRGAGPRGLAGIRPRARPHLPARDRYSSRTSCGPISTRDSCPSETTSRTSIPRSPGTACGTISCRCSNASSRPGSSTCWRGRRRSPARTRTGWRPKQSKLPVLSSYQPGTAPRLMPRRSGPCIRRWRHGSPGWRWAGSHRIATSGSTKWSASWDWLRGTNAGR